MTSLWVPINIGSAQNPRLLIDTISINEKLKFEIDSINSQINLNLDLINYNLNKDTVKTKQNDTIK